MSDLTISDSPLVEGTPDTGHDSSVGPGVIQGKPHAGGLDSIPNTQGSKGIAGSLVSCGNLFSAKDGVGAACLPVGAKEGVSQSAQYSELANHAWPAHQAQSTVTNSILPDHTAAQLANNLSTTCVPQVLGTARFPGNN